jgi:hypothetical protein
METGHENAEPATDGALGDRRAAIEQCLRRMDEVSRQIGTVWPCAVSAQDVIDDVRGPW